MADSIPSDVFYPGREPGEIRRPRVSTAKLDPTDERAGVPPDKFGVVGVPLALADKRTSVMLLLYPPEELRDQPLDVIRAVVANGAAGLIETVALEIFKAYTSDPLDGTAARTASEAFAAHADALRRG